MEEKRIKPFFQNGFTTLILLFILAIPSIKDARNWMISWLQKLQRLVYPARGLVLRHTFLAAKGDIRLPAWQSLIFMLLKLMRIKPIREHVVIRVQWIEAKDQFLQHPLT